ncbi:hypothetical protein BK349_28505, partial [Escherichia coli]
MQVQNECSPLTSVHIIKQDSKVLPTECFQERKQRKIPLHDFRTTFSENELRALADALTVTYTLVPDAVLQG